ncbi:hypothetical protein RHECNPAF_930071 [Rhizobium etli CNPAF512]|nr:hypothetical protein RHECNPAF_930071 [Rhizobium etli CNPAF512]
MKAALAGASAEIVMAQQLTSRRCPTSGKAVPILPIQGAEEIFASIAGRMASDRFLLRDARQEDRQKAEQRQVGADAIDEVDAVCIGKIAEQRRTEPPCPEREAEEDAGNQADAARYQLLGKDDDCRKSRSKDQADDDAEHARPEKIRVGKQQCEGNDAEDRKPDDETGTEAIADRSTEESADGDRAEEQEKHQLRLLHAEFELVDDIEGEVAGYARHVDVLRCRQQHEDQQRPDDPVLRQRQGSTDGSPAGVLAPMAHVPVAHPAQHDHADHGDGGKPRDAVLPERQHDEGGKQRTDRLAGIAADLKKGLRKTVATTGGKTGDTRRFRMEDRRTEADQACRQQQQCETAGVAEQNKTAKGARHADRQRIGHRPAVGDDPDHRLQQGSGDLKRHGKKADLHEVQVVIRLEQRVERGEQRLHDVVQHMTEADCHQNRHGRFFETGRAFDNGCHQYLS